MRFNSARPIKALTAREQDGLLEMLFPAEQPEVFTKNRTVDSPYAFRALSADNQSGGRVLNEHETNIAERFFGDMIDLEVVRIVEDDPSAENRTVTTVYNTIYGTNMPDDTLIHELVHVWQYDKGIITPYSAFWEHFIAFLARRTHELYEYNVKPNRKPFRDYGFEQEASILQDAYRVLTEKKPPRRNLDYKGGTPVAEDEALSKLYEAFKKEFQQWHEELTGTQ